MSLPGASGSGITPGFTSAGLPPSTTGLNEQEQAMVKMMTSAMESCPVKTVMAGGMGFALGGAFGLFMSSGQQISSLPVREQLRRGFKDMGSRSYSSAKNFMVVGALFSGTECCIEGLRAKNDLANGIAAGCITGGILGAKAGPQAALLGCAGFAAFSAAIDAYMRQPSD
ncbi:mitochondrial import inner membrane translocase subunit tim22 [Trichophyton equinum CBS 127.97]|uniref:Mitochondrial import inner membrane translocase subunit TIM22 n=1 Tax=Trichophyton equinum (strain ATCC MYA-4606 / CBS 127.97) TaxID=559882 RepID=F2PZ12_TRIEC|nr:mitochondrial import inner membrane translocase subunit tim22 [Trichophyton equinum CBS 127.97]KMQ45926.1 Mitochondrial inner membrane translocase subunit Tim17/Tim22/Tim23/peroxisomal protein PMP24 [Trichophyton rubrum]